MRNPAQSIFLRLPDTGEVGLEHDADALVFVDQSGRFAGQQIPDRTVLRRAEIISDFRTPIPVFTAIHAVDLRITDIGSCFVQIPGASVSSRAA